MLCSLVRKCQQAQIALVPRPFGVLVLVRRIAEPFMHSANKMRGALLSIRSAPRAPSTGRCVARIVSSEPRRRFRRFRARLASHHGCQRTEPWVCCSRWQHVARAAAVAGNAPAEQHDEVADASVEEESLEILEFPSVCRQVCVLVCASQPSLMFHEPVCIMLLACCCRKLWFFSFLIP